MLEIPEGAANNPFVDTENLGEDNELIVNAMAMLQVTLTKYLPIC